MKKLLMSLLVAMSLFSMVNAVDVSASNVGDGQEYAYIITNVTNNEINGIPLNKASDDNRGIFLYQSEVDFKVRVGDKIVVVWGEEEDEFASIERALHLANGDYTSLKAIQLKSLSESKYLENGRFCKRYNSIDKR